MTRQSRRGDRATRPWFGPALTVLLLAGVTAALPAAESTDEPPTLPVAAVDPLPEALRKPVPESLDELRSIQDRVRALIPELQAATVGVQRGPAQGTGVIVSRDGYVLTAAHVSGKPGKRVTLIRADGSRLKAVSLGRHVTLDAGVVKITEPGTWPVAKIGDMADLRHGDWVIGTGHPGGFDEQRPAVVRLGRVILKMKSVIQTDVSLVGGDSGGPLFDLSGRVVGIHSRIGPGSEFNFHVPVSAFADGWHWLIRSEERPMAELSREGGGPLLGVDGVDSRRGSRVTKVFEGSPAAKAGIEVGDVVVRLDDRFVLSQEDLVAAVRHYQPGETVEVRLRRVGEEKTFRVTLAERPARPESAGAPKLDWQKSDSEDEEN